MREPSLWFNPVMAALLLSLGLLKREKRNLDSS